MSKCADEWMDNGDGMEAEFEHIEALVWRSWDCSAAAINIKRRDEVVDESRGRGGGRWLVIFFGGWNAGGRPGRAGAASPGMQTVNINDGFVSHQRRKRRRRTDFKININKSHILDV